MELVYDLNNQPSFWLVEPLLYKSRYYDRSQQSLMLSKIQNDGQPFVLNTPCLESEDSLHLRRSFDDEMIDELFRLKSIPNRGKTLLKCCRPDSQHALLRSFLTPGPPLPYVPYEGAGVRWRYFGHACILIESQGTSILFDPVLSYTYENQISRYTYLDLPESIGYVLITRSRNKI